MASPGKGGKLSFAQDIRPLSREKDRDSMLSAFDLFDYEDVADNADDIVGPRLAARRVTGPSPESGDSRR